MELIVWNSQGAKWDDLWEHYLEPEVNSDRDDDIQAYTVESGWAPWVESGKVRMNSIYSYDSMNEYFDEDTSDASSFCQGVSEKRGRYAAWIPWVRNVDALKTNTRCSMGFFSRLVGGRKNDMSVISRYDYQYRPLVRCVISKGRTTVLTVILVHLVSGNQTKAKKVIDYLIGIMSKLIPEGSAGLVTGDMNINLLTNPITLDPPWSILNVGVATQQKGGELDYALLYDPAGHLSDSTASVLEQYKTGNNDSDHSVMQYTVNI